MVQPSSEPKSSFLSIIASGEDASIQVIKKTEDIAMMPSVIHQTYPFI